MLVIKEINFDLFLDLQYNGFNIKGVYMKARFVKFELLILVTLFFFASCTTLSQQSNLLSAYEDENVAAVVAVSNNFVELNLKNKTKSVVTLSVDGSTTTMKNGETSKLVPEGTRFLEFNALQSPLSIAPLGTLNKSFVPAHAIKWDTQNTKWDINNWVDRDNFSLIFPYIIDGVQKHIVIQTSLMEKENIIGSVQVSKNYWHILWVSSDRYQDELYNMGLEEAIKLYGNDIKLVNGSYKGIWSPFSLVLYFNMLGYVDEVTFTADVQKK